MSLIVPKRYREESVIEECGKRAVGNELLQQSVYERSTVQRFDIGARWQMGERVFRYAKSKADLTDLNYPVINSHIIPDDGYEGAIVGTAVIGDKTITIADTGAVAARPENYYQGAYIQIYRDPGAGASVTNFDQQRRVIASTVGNGVSITLTLDYPLTCDVNATVDVYPSQYSEINKAASVSSGEETFVGFASALLQTDEYGWVQTWGPVNGHYNIKFPGERGPNDRDCYFIATGAIVTLSQSGSFVGKSYQRAGYVIPVTKTLYGSVFIQLQLSP